MRLITTLFYWGALLTTLVSANGDEPQARRQVRKDLSGRGGDPPQKYFHESVFHPHYDGRFSDHVLPYNEQRMALKSLVQTYLATFADIGVETWLMHGSLLGWWWNKHIMPWDSDIDVQVTEPSMYYLAAYYNMSVFHYQTPRLPEGRDYMLEINPNHVNREQSDKMNKIDARWIDTATGLFIDITTARYNLTHPAGHGILSCKDGHTFRDTWIFPLRDTVFEDTPVKIPFEYANLLESEYGKKSMTNKDYHDHLFDDDRMEWVPKIKTKDIPEDKSKGI